MVIAFVYCMLSVIASARSISPTRVSVTRTQFPGSKITIICIKTEAARKSANFLKEYIKKKYPQLAKVAVCKTFSKGLQADVAKCILGAQGNLWTEYIDNPQKVEYMVFPRMRGDE